MKWPTTVDDKLMPQMAVKQRFVALDTYRGFIMLMLIQRSMFPSSARHPELAWILTQFDHVEWEGVVFWDLIQPAFMFMVGIAMPFAIAHRLSQGATGRQIFYHVMYRMLKLVVLGQIIWSIATGQLSFYPIQVLSQIGLTYFVTFLILQIPYRLQILLALLLLGIPWALFVLFPGSEGPFSKVDNIGLVIDRALFGINYPGHYMAIDLVGGTVITLFGAWTGIFLSRERPRSYILKILLTCAAMAFIISITLELVNPIIKRLWTASFIFYSTAWALLFLIGFYWLFKVKQYRKLAFPFVVVGVNSIFIYCVSTLLRNWVGESLNVFTHHLQFVSAFAPGLAKLILFVGVNWYLCYWLYQRKIFIKL